MGDGGKYQLCTSAKDRRWSARFWWVLFDHFGHFLADTLARIWAVKKQPAERVAWICLPGFQGLKPWQKQIFELLGVDEGRFEYVQTAVEFEDLSLPSPAYICSDWGDVSGIAALASVPFRLPVTGKKLWLSRASLPRKDGGVDNEMELKLFLATVCLTMTCYIGNAQLEKMLGQEATTPKPL